MMWPEGFGAASASPAVRLGLRWLFTYVLHGAILGAAASILVRGVRPAPAAENRLWKMALFVPLLSASIAVLMEAHMVGAALGKAPVVLRIPLAPAAASHGSHGKAVASGVALVAALGIAAGLARFAIGRARLRRRLHRGRTAADPRLVASLARVLPRFDLGPIQLTGSAHLASPAAVAASAVWFPAGDIASITDAEIDAALAHELAHLERRDPLWFFLAGLMQGALWMQPLNHRLAARFRRSAELACDDRAVAVTGDARDLAKAIGWFAHHAYAGQPSLSDGAGARSALVERVRRLASIERSPALPSRTIAFLSGTTAVALAFAAASSAAVTVGFASSDDDARPRATAAASTSARLPGVDMAAVGRRVAELGFAEIQLQAQLDAAGARIGDAPRDRSTSPRILELEQDLRHSREERAWLERTVYRNEP